MKSVQLSQNFLKNQKLVNSIIQDSSIGKTDTVLEIGPGKGVITEELLKVTKKVIAVELDKELFNFLTDKFKTANNLELFNSDFYSFTLPSQPYKVFSNIPFRFTADFIHKLLRSKNPPQDTYLIVQKEVAEKFMGNNLVAVFYQPYYIFQFNTGYNEQIFHLFHQWTLFYSEFKNVMSHLLKKNTKNCLKILLPMYLVERSHILLA